MSRKTKFAVRSVEFRTARDCLDKYLTSYEGILRYGFWKDRERDEGETSWYMGVEDSWVEIEMRLGHLPSFMQIVGYPVILDVERPEILTHTDPKRRSTLHKWSMWTGPPRPAYKLTIYDGYRE